MFFSTCSGEHRIFVLICCHNQFFNDKQSTLIQLSCVYIRVVHYGSKLYVINLKVSYLGTVVPSCSSVLAVGVVVVYIPSVLGMFGSGVEVGEGDVSPQTESREAAVA